MDLTKLKLPFPSKRVEWRIQSSGRGQNGVWAVAVPYLTTSAIIYRLDAEVGPENWRDQFVQWHTEQNVNREGAEVITHSQLCGLSIKVGTEWVTKWDGASSTNIEGIKGGLSDAFKRAATKWGIGLYLRHIEPAFVQIVDRNDPGAKYGNGWDEGSKNRFTFYWVAPSLPYWAVPENEREAVKPIQPEPQHQPQQQPVAPPAQTPPPQQQQQTPPADQVVDQKILNDARLVCSQVTDKDRIKLVAEALKLQHQNTGVPNVVTMEVVMNLYRARYKELEEAELDRNASTFP